MLALAKLLLVVLHYSMLGAAGVGVQRQRAPRHRGRRHERADAGPGHRRATGRCAALLRSCARMAARTHGCALRTMGMNQQLLLFESFEFRLVLTQSPEDGNRITKIVPCKRGFVPPRARKSSTISI